MKLIIAGSRDIVLSPEEVSILIKEKIENWEQITEVVSGESRGIDKSGEKWAETLNIPIKPFPAEWTKLGDAAGPIRNRKMALYGDVLLLIWDGKSTGSANMRARMKGMGKPVFEVIRSTNL